MTSLGVVAQDRRDLAAAERYQLQALGIYEALEILERSTPDGLDVAEALTTLGQLRAGGANPALARALLDRLAALHATLIAPASSVLRGKRRLIIVPDGNLHRIPWATLDPTRRWWHSPLQRTRAQRAALSPQRRRMRPEES